MEKNSIRKLPLGFQNKLFIVSLLTLAVALPTASAQEEHEQSLATLAGWFAEPPMPYRPCVWWHWLGSNFRKEGITKDLEAMKEAGIGGACIFNIASSVQNTHAPIGNNPWPEQTFRGEAYWDCFGHTLKEARRLGLKIGLHNTPGYATTGGPWIDEPHGMQTLVFTKKQVSVPEGGKTVDITLERPELPIFYGFNNEGLPWGAMPTSKRATYYREVCVVAVPDREGVQPDEVIDITSKMDTLTGKLHWQAPAGAWNIARIGHAPTMAHPHPLPDDIIGKCLEADKMSREATVVHWKNVIDPLKARFSEYFGNTFTYLWIDSYESGDQTWTPLFRSEFKRLKGYDPIPNIAIDAFTEKERDDMRGFHKDFAEVVSRLFIDNGWKPARDMVHEAGLKLYWEPYWGPWDAYESVSIPDVPCDEFWTGGDGRVGQRIPRASHEFGKRVLGAEAFTGRPEVSKYTEDPAFLKRTADGGFVSGFNWYYLHHWVLQPFDDRYQPGMGMGWWGTHFSRYQTWIHPAKAFFTYLARCQMMLQQGSLVVFQTRDILHKHLQDAELFFIVNQTDNAVDRWQGFPVTQRTPELWDAAKGTINRPMEWKTEGDSTFVHLSLTSDESVFVIFPNVETQGHASPNLRATSLPKIPKVVGESRVAVEGPWQVTFNPKLDKPFTRTFAALSDFSKSDEAAIRYFAGTAVYTKPIRLKAADLKADRRVVIDLGRMEDIAELTVNGQSVGVLWYPPYKADITPWLKAGDNSISIAVTTNWANRLIGDEQEHADFEWDTDRGEAGRAMKAFPEWFVKNQPRPSQGRKTFTIWYYYRKDSPLQPEGLMGPVEIVKQRTTNSE